MPVRQDNDRPDAPELMELFQAEWCPASRRVRELLTELVVSYVIRQVPVDRADRDALLAVTGSRVIPALVLESGIALIDEAEIRAWLQDHVPTPAGAAHHRAKAESMRRLEIEGAPGEPARPHSLDTPQLEVSR
jgi:glutathione S-transferase